MLACDPIYLIVELERAQQVEPNQCHRHYKHLQAQFLGVCSLHRCCICEGIWLLLVLVVKIRPAHLNHHTVIGVVRVAIDHAGVTSLVIIRGGGQRIQALPKVHANA